MAKSFAKYFIALVPEGIIQEKATDLKELLKENFNLKYALKSPAHITIKMPFHWNELKDEKLTHLLQSFFKDKRAFQLKLSGFNKFGRRVIFIDVVPTPELLEMQRSLGEFAKTELKQPIELSDKSFHPHMTVAFKDIKFAKFDEYWQFIKKQAFDHVYPVNSVALLKRIEGRWVLIQSFPLLSLENNPT